MNLLLLSFGLGAVTGFIKPPVKIGFIPTAGDIDSDPWYVRENRAHLTGLDYSVEDIDISNASRTTIIAQLSNIDCLFVAGGNTFYLMQQLRKKDMTGDLCRLVRSGLPYIGSSAGSVIVGPSIAYIKTLDDPADAPDLQTMDGLGLTDFAVLPHAKDGNRDDYNRIVESHRPKMKIVSLSDDQAVITQDGQAFTIIPSPLLA